MLLSRRAATIAHVSFVQQLPLRNLFARLRPPLCERNATCTLLRPPACLAPVGSNHSFAVVDQQEDEPDMGEDLDRDLTGPSAKRQRTDDGPATYVAGGGSAGINVQSNGAPPVQHEIKKDRATRKKRENPKDARIPVMQHAVKRNNLKFAMERFREALAEGGNLPISILNSLLYVAVGGDLWERYARGLPALMGAEAVAAAAAAAAAAGDGGAVAGAEGDDATEPQQHQQQAKSQQQRPANWPSSRPWVPNPEGPPPTKEELLAAADELWSYMQSSGMKPDQGTYLALARREALLGNPQAALQWAQGCLQDGKPAQLRLFHPAQVGYCLCGDVAQLHHIDSLIASHRLDNTEYEFARLLEGIAEAGTYEQMRAVLMRMQSDMNQMSPETANYITSFFEKNAAAQQAFAAADQGGCPGLARHIAASGGGGDGDAGWRWRVVQDAVVTEGGQCESAGGVVKVIDLEDEEWDAFAKAIAELARKNMGSRAGDFDMYVQWYERNGPYDIMVDAANVAFFGQNREGGGFNWRQVQHMYELLRQRFPQKKILVMMHRKRISDAEARVPDVQEFIERLRCSRSFYHTPPGANDDWFWLYASVRAKHNGLLISNDELRDHIFSLLRPKHFLKWKERHIAHYRLASNNPTVLATAQLGKLFILQMPHQYTACVQQLGESGAWVLPVSDGTWRCVVPERVQG